MLIGSRIIWHNKSRMLLSSAGISMACVIIFLEQGFFNGIIDSQLHITRLIRGDIVILHRTRTHLDKWNSFDRIRTFQIKGLESIESITPLYKASMGLRNNDTDEIKRIIVYAFPAETMPLDLADSARQMLDIKLPRHIFFDRKSRDIYGEITDEIELDGRIYSIAGYVDIGPNIINDGAVVMSQASLLSVQSWKNPIMGIIKIKKGSDINQVRERIEQLYPDLVVMTPDELAIREINFTSTSAPIGIIFRFGMIAGFIIGVIVCYQVLFNEIADQYSQYATLKAIGFSDKYLGKIILEQAMVLSAMGYILSVPIVMYLYRTIADGTSLPMSLSFGNSLFVLLLTILMCIVAGFIAMKKIWRSDPAELF